MRDLARDEHGVLDAARLGELGMCVDAAPRTPASSATGATARSTLDLELAAGEHHDLVLVISTDQARRAAPPDADAAWRETEQAWRERVGEFEQTIAPRDAAHACAVISG